VAGWLAAALAGQPLEVRSDDPRRDWTFTPDLAPALERVVEGPPAGHPVHLGSPFVYSDRALATLVLAQVRGTRGGAPTDRVPMAGLIEAPLHAPGLGPTPAAGPDPGRTGPASLPAGPRGPAPGRLKPPMVPSDIPALRGFAWTDPPTGIRAIVAGQVAA
jgi:hypothetical protein